MSEQRQEFIGSRIVLVLASTVVVVAGLKAAAPILLPFALALFMGVLVLPMSAWLKRKGVPGSLATAISVLVEVGVVALIIYLGSQSLPAFQEAYPRYEARFQILLSSWVDSARGVGIPIEQNIALFDFLDPSSLFSIAGSTLQRVASLVSYAFLVVLLLIFVLQEATVFPQKVQAALGGKPLGGHRFTSMVRDVQRYLGIKTVVSLATGLIVGLWCWIMNLDFPVLLGLLAFMLNFVPTIGSILAGIPAVLLGLILHGFGHSLAVAAGYVVVNTIFGNIIEPNLMGRRLGLSTLVVILSLIFWGWVWGPVGMILSVPLTMVLKILFENTEDFRWISILLDKGVPQLAGAAAGGAESGLEDAPVVTGGPDPSDREPNPLAGQPAGTS
jgi:predicted PurR-regulated permease PerM